MLADSEGTIPFRWAHHRRSEEIGIKVGEVETVLGSSNASTRP
jgi:hypothetical protein